MKTLFFPFLLTGIFLSGCASNSSPQSSTSAKSSQQSTDEDEKPPFVGMTKEQARTRYGDPNREAATDEGETWIYVRGIGAAMGKALIPFYFGGRDIKTASLTFGPDGRVKKFSWDTHTDN